MNRAYVIFEGQVAYFKNDGAHAIYSVRVQSIETLQKMKRAAGVLAPSVRSQPPGETIQRIPPTAPPDGSITISKPPILLKRYEPNYIPWTCMAESKIIFLGQNLAYADHETSGMGARQRCLHWEDTDSLRIAQGHHFYAIISVSKQCPCGK